MTVSGVIRENSDGDTGIGGLCDKKEVAPGPNLVFCEVSDWPATRATKNVLPVKMRLNKYYTLRPI